ncbi:GtrA family protein [Lysobacter sp. A378]
MKREQPNAESRFRQLVALCRSEKFRFLAVGAWNTLFGYIVFCFVHIFWGGLLGVIGTLITSYAIALPQSFLTQRLLVFRAAGAWPRELSRFSLASSVIFTSNLVFLPVAVHATGSDPAVVQAAFMVLSTFVSYLTHKHFSFSR